MNTAICAVYGASGFGREVMPLVRSEFDGEVVFVDDSPSAQVVNGCRVVSYQDFASSEFLKKYVCIAIADNEARKKISERCEKDGIVNFGVVCKNSVVLDDVSFGEGVIVCPYSTVTSNVVIGKFFHMNIYSYVAHDCIIGDYVTFAPAVKCNGNVIVEDGAYIGTGAIIKQGRPGKPVIIGANSVVGMGAVVTKNVPPGSVVVGNPAKPLSKDFLK